MEIQQSFKGNQEVGCLYLVPTPIGNLEDMSVRGVKCLQTVDLIAAEDTRNTQKLLNHFEITTPQKSLHEHNFKERIPQLLALLQGGKDIAQVSDAGMPSISDPGHELVLACLVEKIKVIALPGPTAGLTALLASGLSPQPNYFYGFLPRKKNEQKAVLASLYAQEATLIFYESPHRVKETLANMQGVFGERQAVICRELTKLHEEYLRGTFSELLAYLDERELKGECCLLVAGNSQPEEQQEMKEISVKEEVQALIDQGMKPNAAIKTVAQRRSRKKQEIYQEYHELS